MTRAIRISGLVRIANDVRRKLAAPLSASQRTTLREHVAQQLRELELTLREHGANESHLPNPSRRAMQFLREIDWNHLPEPVATPAIAAPPERRLTWPGLTAFVDRALRRLADATTDEQFETVRLSLERQSRLIEDSLRRHGEQPEQLSESLRAARGWIAFFSLPENREMYAAAQRLAVPILSRSATTSQCPLPLCVHFRPMSGIYRYRSSAQGSVVSLPTPMIAFDADTFEALSRQMFLRDRSRREAVIRAMVDEPYQSVRAELESLGGVVEQPGGAFHDLRAVFDRVNAQYFDGTMPRPHLTWSRSFTGRKFGHYDYVRDKVMVSASLDRPDVEAFVVEYLMFHELLHKKQGTRWKNGRGLAHTPAFVAEERRFPRYQEADDVLKRIAAAS